MKRKYARNGLIVKLSLESLSLKYVSINRILRGAIISYRQPTNSIMDYATMQLIDELAAPARIEEFLENLRSCDNDLPNGAINMLSLLRQLRDTGKSYKMQRLFDVTVDELIDLQTNKIIASIQTCQPEPIKT